MHVKILYIVVIHVDIHVYFYCLLTCYIVMCSVHNKVGIAHHLHW